MKIKQLWDTAPMKTSKKISLVLAVTSAIVWIDVTPFKAFFACSKGNVPILENQRFYFHVSMLNFSEDKKRQYKNSILGRSDGKTSSCTADWRAPRRYRRSRPDPHGPGASVRLCESLSTLPATRL